MATRAGLNKNNSAVKRIMQEARELANDPSTDYTAAPLEDDIFEWHCTIRGPAGTEFEGGLYHFRILLPTEYPFRPPSIMMLTPNGRFELNTKICISFTSYHEELWQPAWGVRTAIIGLQGFFPLKGTAAVGVGAIEYPAAERKRLAALSKSWVCSRCGHSNLECLPDPPASISESSGAAVPAEASEPVPPAANVASVPPPMNLHAPQPAHPGLAAPVIHSPVPLVAPSPIRPVMPMSLYAASSPSSPSSPVASSGPSRARSPADTDTESSRSSGSSEQPEEPALAQEQVELPIIIPSSRRPPVVLDTAICVLLVLVFALIARRFL